MSYYDETAEKAILGQSEAAASSFEVRRLLERAIEIKKGDADE